MGLARRAQRISILFAAAALADSRECAGCHPRIVEVFRASAMGRSVAAPDSSAPVGSYYHPASDRYYRVYWRDGKYYQQRHQVGFEGRRTNEVEKEIHFVLGSGHHGRAFLHRTQQGKLVQLPLSWYPAGGGYWAMGPGYDRPDHPDFRREVTEDCVFCHSAYPAGGRVAAPIDCERCHGPGEQHILTASRGASQKEIRSAIVNPARLSHARRMEVCFQCHLETTSAPLPYAIRRYGRGMFSYRPGEPLEDYMIHFDHAAGAGYDDKFEVVHAAYRLLKSACYRKSGGSMTCTTCHDPHGGARELSRVCQGCHASAHSPEAACADCHMPKRRTEDAVHVVMTDHYIQRRRAAGDPLAPRTEQDTRLNGAYRGAVTLYYPPRLPRTPETALYLALAQVKDGANPRAGIARLEGLLARLRPAHTGFYFELAEAYRLDGQLDRAVQAYQEALRRQPGFLPVLRKLALVLAQTGRLASAVGLLERAPEDAFLSATVGEVYLRQGHPATAERVLRKAVALDGDLPEAFNSLGAALSARKADTEAEAAFREAIRVQPDFALAHANLARLLALRGDARQAEHHFETAVRLDPQNPQTRLHYRLLLNELARRLAAAGHQEEARRRLRRAEQMGGPPGK